MILLVLIGSTIGGWWHRAIVALAEPAPHAERDLPREYYKFPPY